MNTTKFQSLQNSWMADEASELRTKAAQEKTDLSPLNLKAQRQVTHNQLITQIIQSNNNTNLGNPSSRQDAILLILWFEKTLQSIQNELPNEQRDEKLFPMLQLTMNICVKELSRQVSVQCQERGIIITKVFKSYAKLIDLIHRDNREKRWKLKRNTADKLDKYIQIQEEQIQGYKNKIESQRSDYDKLKWDLDNCLYKLNQNNILTSKFKKKCYNAQKDLEIAQRKMKFLEFENADLKAKL